MPGLVAVVQPLDTCRDADPDGDRQEDDVADGCAAERASAAADGGADQGRDDDGGEADGPGDAHCRPPLAAIDATLGAEEDVGPRRERRWRGEGIGRRVLPGIGAGVWTGIGAWLLGRVLLRRILIAGVLRIIGIAHPSSPLRLGPSTLLPGFWFKHDAALRAESGEKPKASPRAFQGVSAYGMCGMGSGPYWFGPRVPLRHPSSTKYQMLTPSETR